MDRKKKAQAVFAKLQSQKPNQHCVDCDVYNPQWASVNNACFFCIKCAGTHRSLGVHLTFVRSVGMDEWSDKQLACMKVGGNAQLKKFWSDQGFPPNLPSKEKYDNEAMEAYRAYIKARAAGEKKSLPGKIGYQKRIRKKKNYAGGSMGSSSMGYQPKSSRKQEDDIWASFASSVGSSLSTVGSSLNTGISKLSEQSQQIDTDQLSQSVKAGWGSLSSWVSDISAKAAANINSLADDDDDFTSQLRNNLGPSKRKMQGMGNSSSNDEDEMFPRRKIGTGKKMAALGSDQYFSQSQQESRGRGSSSSGKTKKKYGGLSSEDYFSNEKTTPKKKKYGGLSSEDYFSSEKSEPSRSSRSRKKEPVKIIEEEEDLDDFGFSDDDDDVIEEPKKIKALGKIAKVEDDDEDVDFDNWGWDDDAPTKV